MTQLWLAASHKNNIGIYALQNNATRAHLSNLQAFLQLYTTIILERIFHCNLNYNDSQFYLLFVIKVT